MTSIEKCNQKIIKSDSTERVSSVSIADKTSKPNCVFEDKSVSVKNNTDFETQSRLDVYKKIENLCEEYGMTLEDVMQAQLLEGILGCDPEQLVLMNEEELNNAISALSNTLKWEILGFLKGDKDVEDIISIRKKANKKYIHTLTGRKTLDSVFRKHGDLDRRLKDKGIIAKDVDINNLTDEELKSYATQYFQEIVASAIASGDEGKIAEAYEKAFKIYGDMLVDIEDVRQKEVLTAAISELAVDDRLIASKVSIASCGVNLNERSKVAVAVFDNMEDIVCREDALGNVMEQTDAMLVAENSFQAMITEDAFVSKEKLEMKSREFKEQFGDEYERIKQKYANGELLSEDELQIYLKGQNYVEAGNAGAVLGIFYNADMTTTEKEQAIQDVLDVVSELGYGSDVLNLVAKSISDGNKSLPIAVRNELVKTLDKLTNNNFSKILEDVVESKTSSIKQNSVKPYNSKSYKKQTDFKLSTKAEGDKEIASFDKTKSYTLSKSDNIQVQRNATVLSNEKLSGVSNPITLASEKENIADKPPVSRKVSSIIDAISEGQDSFENYIRENNSHKTVVEIFNNARFITEKWVFERGLYIYENMSAEEQAETLRHSNNSALSELLPTTSLNALLRLQGETFENYYATQQVQEAVVKKAEENNVSLNEKEYC